MKRLCAAIAVAAIAEFLIATTGTLVRGPAPPHTDFASFYMAGKFAGDRRSPYDTAALAGAAQQLGLAQATFPFVYPPPFALAMRPLAALPFETARHLWILFTTACALAALGMTWRLCREQAAALALHGDAWVPVVMAAFVPAALNSAPLHSDVRVGSVGALLWLCGATVAWGMLQPRRRAVPVGLALAVAVLAKTTPVVWVAWVAWRGGRRAVAWCTVLVTLALIPACITWGPGILGVWLRDGIWARLGQPSGWAHNHSVDAVIFRLLQPAARDDVFVQASGLQHAISAASSLALAIFTVYVLRRARDTAWRRPLEFGLVVVALLLITPISWIHTLSGLLFLWPVLILSIAAHTQTQAQPPGLRRARTLAIAASAGFFLTAAHTPFVWGARFHVWPGVLLTTVPLWGMFVMMWATARAMAAHDVSASA